MSLDRINLLVDKGDYPQALPLVERALARAPSDLELVSLMSFVLTKLAQHARAEHFARRLLAAMPEHPHALHNLGNILTVLGRHDDAIPLLTHAFELAHEPQTAIALGNAYFALSRFASSLDVLQQALTIHPANFLLRNNYAHSLHACGHIDDALPILRQLTLEAPQDHGLADAMCSVLNYAPDATPQDIFNAHLHYGQLIERVTPVPSPFPAPVPTPPLRLGLLSSDLREHAVAHLIEDILTHHDRSRLHITCYAGPSIEDDTTRRLRTLADDYRSVTGLSHAQAAAIIRKNNTHILIDLNGHTKGQMLQVLAHRAAPVQMTYTGYPNTTGLRTCDFRIVDSLTDPASSSGGGADRYHTEKLLRLDPCYMSYRPPRDLPAITRLPDSDFRLPTSDFPLTFGSFSSLLKLNNKLIALWGRVLAAVPNSRLVLMHTGLTEEAVRDDVRQRFAALSIDPARIDPRPPLASRQGVLPAYNDIDIALDTFPYNGAVTIVEALLMGVPYVTLAGHTSASRAALSILTAVGHPDLCATTEDQYVQIARDLANDPLRRHALRTQLRARVLQSPICDGPAFCQRLTALLQAAYQSRLTEA